MKDLINFVIAFSATFGLEKLLAKCGAIHQCLVLADPVTAVVAVVAVASAGYGAFSGEKARKTAAQQYADAKSQAERDRINQEAQVRADKQEMEDLAAEQKKEQEATLAKIKGEIPGIQNQLGSDLLTQQNYAYDKITPQLEARLNALGLLKSGALAESQSKAYKDLEMQRQAILADFGTKANASVSLDKPYDLMKDNLQAERDNLAQEFANQNNLYINEAGQNQYLANLGAANNAANQNSANAYLNLGGQIGSGLITSYANNQKNPSLDALYKYKMKNFYGSGNQGPVPYGY